MRSNICHHRQKLYSSIIVQIVFLLTLTAIVLRSLERQNTVSVGASVEQSKLQKKTIPVLNLDLPISTRMGKTGRNAIGR